MAAEELRLLRNQVPSLQAEAARLREAAVACKVLLLPSVEHRPNEQGHSIPALK